MLAGAPSREAVGAMAALEGPEETYESYRAKGRAAAREGEPAAALRWFRAAANIRAEDPANRVDMAEQLFELGQRQDASSLFMAALREPRAALDGLCGLGRIAMIDGDDALAESCWHIVSRLAPRDIWAGHNRATCLLRMGRLAEAELRYRDHLNAFPHFKPSWRGLGQVAYASGRHRESLEHFEKALELSPDDVQSMLDCARQCLLLDALDAARAHLDKAAAIAPEDNRVAEVAATLAAVVATRRAETDSTTSQAIAPIDSGGPENANVAARSDVSRQDPLSPAADDLLLRGGEAALRERRFEVALHAFTEALATAPDDIRARHGLALALIELGRGDEAQPMLEALAAPEPPHAESLAALGRIAARGGRNEEATAYWRRASTARPDDLWLQNDIGHLAVDHGDLELGEERFCFILGRDPQFFHAIRGRARVAKARGDVSEALAWFEKAAELEPEDPWMQWEIATLEASLWQSAAADRFQRILKLRPDFTPAHQGLARWLLATGDAPAAARLLGAASELRPDDCWIRFDLARAWRAKGDSEAAKRILTELAGGGPASTAARLELHYLAREVGEDTEGRNILREALSASPSDPHLRIAEANRLVDDGRLSEAEAIYDDFEHKGLEPYWSGIGKGAIARKRGLSSQARSWFRRAIAIEPRSLAAYVELCGVACTDADAEDVLQKLDTWIASSPESLAPRLQKARFLAQRSNYRDALAEFASMAKIRPLDVAIQVEWARLEERVGETESATQRLDRAASLNAGDPTLLEAMARRAEWRDDLELAGRLIALALERAPSRPWLRAASVRLTFLAGHVDEAFRALEDLRGRHASDPEVEFLHIDMLRQTGRLDDALAASRRARSRWSDHFRLRWQGVCLDVDLGRFAAARLAIQTATPANGLEQSGVEFLAGYCAMAQWRFDSGRPRLEAAWRANRDDGWALNRLIHCDLMLFDVSAAGEHLKALARLDHSFNRVKGKSVSFTQTHYGQIYDEFRLDEAALEYTARALALETFEPRLRALREGLHLFPRYTPIGIAFLVACRQAGLLAANTATETAGGAIPTDIVQFWDAADLPRDMEPYVESWKLHNPHARYRRYDAEMAEGLLAEIDAPEALRAFRRASQPAMQADIFRLAYLHRYGGVYADADDRCLRSVAPLFSNGASLVLYQEDLGSVGNNFIMTVPRHPVLKRALDEAVTAVNSGAGDLLWLATGPGALTRALCGFLVEDEARWRDRLTTIRIFDRHEMLNFVAIHCLSTYKSTERHWSRSAFGKSNTNTRRNNADFSILEKIEGCIS